MAIYYVYTARWPVWEDADGMPVGATFGGERVATLPDGVPVVATFGGERVATLPDGFDPEGTRCADDVLRVVSDALGVPPERLEAWPRGDYWAVSVSTPR